MAYKRKIDRRFWDPTVWCHGYGSVKCVKRANLARPEHIEALRWRFLNRWEEKVHPKIRAAWDELKRLGEAFYHREGIDAPGRPVRIDYSEHYSGEGSSSIDNDFWKYAPPKLSGKGPVRDLADIGALKDWEKNVLPEKLARVTEEKLKAGEAYWANNGFWRARWRRIEKINQILATSIKELDFLPRGRPHREDIVIVRLNGRDYPWMLRYHYHEPLFKKWPEPGEETKVITVPRFEIDDSLIGKPKDVVRTRHGEPVATFAARKRDQWPNIWIYGAAGVRFGKDGLVSKVLDAKAVTRILKTAK